ncbi:hypothetical protein Vretimale_4450, partial [Volvox reticuliferus]
KASGWVANQGSLPAATEPTAKPTIGTTSTAATRAAASNDGIPSGHATSYLCRSFSDRDGRTSSCCCCFSSAPSTPARWRSSHRICSSRSSSSTLNQRCSSAGLLRHGGCSMPCVLKFAAMAGPSDLTRRASRVYVPMNTSGTMASKVR